jgi:signal transduction histidine kinase/putative methionine-R-sulfoxide reductase with GAF domain
MNRSFAEEKEEQKKREKEASTDLERRIAAQTKELAALNTIAAAVSSSLDLNNVLNRALDKTLEVMEIDAGGIYLLDEGTGVLDIVAHRGFAPDFVEGIEKLRLGEGFSGRVAQSGQPLLVRDVSADPRLTRSVVRDAGLRSAAIFPLSSKGTVLGTFFTIARSDREFSEQDVQLLTSIGHQIGVAIENARLYEQAQQRMRELEALHRADTELYRHLSLEEVLQALVDIGVDILKADKSFLIVWDEGRERLVVKAARGLTPETMALLFFSRREGSVGHVAGTGEPLIMEDTLADSRRKDERPEVVQAAVLSEGVRSFIHLPIKIGDDVFGVFNASFTTPHTFNEDELRLFTALAGRAALAIENAHLYEQAQQMAALGERNRLARELHDSVKQQALAASFQLGTAITLFDREPETAKKHIIEADHLVNSVRVELTDLIHELRPPTMNGQDFAVTLNDYAIEWAHQSGIEVNVDVQGNNGLSLEVKQTLFRILQEALANVARHSDARSVDVSLSYGSDTVSLTITDDGSGFDTSAQHDGMGLNSMWERAETLKGEFTVESEPGEGTRIIVALLRN